MIFHAVNPRSDEWKSLRLGRLCSSEFHKVLKPATLMKEAASSDPDVSKVISTQATDLMYRLIAEHTFKMATHEIDGINEMRLSFMERGTELEDKAIMAYEMLTDTETSPGGFCTTDDGLLGCSPDRLIGTTGDLEIKAPLIHTQVAYALQRGVDDDYMVQLQGRMLIHKREWVDIFPWHPRLNIPPKRVYRNEAVISLMRVALDRFNILMQENRLRLEREFGPFEIPQMEVPPDYSHDFVSDDDVEMILKAQRAG